MVRRSSAALLCLACSLSSSVRADASKESPTPVVMVARFHDGSVMHQLRIADGFQVKTRYGELTVPLDSVKRVEFAPRVSEEQTAQIEQAIRQLNSQQFAEREAASRRLTAFGVRGLPALRQAAASREAEVARRASIIIEQVRRAAPEEPPAETPTNDVIYTTDSVLRGRIATAKVKGESSIFGTLQIALSDLRSLHLEDRHERLTLESEVLSQAPDPWLDSGLQVEAGEGLRIAASGKIDLAAGQRPGRFVSGPNGMDERHSDGEHRPGQLLGRVGKDGPVFVVGQRYQGKAAQSGTLFLQVGFLGDPDLKPKGSYQVRVSSGWGAGQD